MKSCAFVLAVVCALLFSLAAVDVAVAAPSLPVTKLPVTGALLTGPNLDPAATNGQWFMNLSSGGEEHRTHEFHDNVLGAGGGSMTHFAITGHVSRVVTTPISGEITAFDITATINNDTAQAAAPWMAGTNSHDEVNNDPEKWYYGTLKDTKLTAEFAISTNDPAFPQSWVGPYVPGVGADIVAANEDQLAWYCWNVEQQGAEGGPGNYHVPTWDFGDIPQGGSRTRVLQFTVSGAGITALDPRHTVIQSSYDEKSDILLNRTTSLKVSTWLDSLAPDLGVAYPHLTESDPMRSSDVSVFHNEDTVDFGDAPYDGVTNRYETRLLQNGARHSIVTGVMLGAAIDAELDGQPSLGAVGDDSLGTIPDDEDGVSLRTPLYPGMIASVDVTVSVGGLLNIWVDFAGDGSWAEPGDYVIQNRPVVAGVNRVGLSVPALAMVGSAAYSRVRFSTTTNVTAVTGYASDGEVEDYRWLIESAEEARDYGDAPNTYLTTLASGGAMHNIGGGSGPWLGDASNGPDPDTDGQPNPNALGDDGDGNDDERGVWIATGTELVRGVLTTYSVEVSGAAGQFQMWVDWNANGVFDHPSEMAVDMPLAVGVHYPTLTAPMDAVPGSTFIRCRISSAGGLGPAGAAVDGEVEDHALVVADGYVDWGEIQWPTNEISAIVGTASETIYGRCWHDNLTPPSTNPAPGLVAEVGYGPDGSDTPWDGNWTWFGAVFNSQVDQPNDDEYAGALTIGAVGTYDYAYRYSRNSTEWTYGDLDGSNNGYTNTQAGSIVVSGLPAFSVTNVSLVATSDTATVYWQAQDRVVYQLQYLADLVDTNLTWTNVGSEVTGNTATDTNAVPSNRFYRVIAPYAGP